ncbi:hypothetical protein AGMMS49975_15020 [Clostridia bacterium]|nr:hypothetical protein AGMMS49975_15020 [Clostridia bacterium]
MRQAKREAMVANDAAEIAKANNKIKAYSDKINEHIDKYGLLRQRQREGIGKTRYGNNPLQFGGTDKFIAQRAVAAYERQTGQPAPDDFLTKFLPKMAGVSDYTVIKKEVYKYLSE